MYSAPVAHTGKTSGDQQAVTSDPIDTSIANLIIVGIGSYSAVNAVGALSDSRGNTWQPLTEKGAGATQSAQLFYCEGTGIGGAGHTFSVASVALTYPVILVMAIKTAATSPFDQENGVDGAGPTLQPGSVTPLEDNELVVSFLGYQVTGGSTIDSGFTQSDDIDNSPALGVGGSMAYKIQTTAQAENPTWTVTGGGAITPVIASFKTGADSTPTRVGSLLMMLR
jgi:hypothetical protein